MRLRIGFFSIVVFLACSSAFGQALVDGRIVNGNVFKPVAGIEVHLVNKSLGVNLPFKTAPDGRYSFDNVAPGKGFAVDVLDSTGKLIGTDPNFDVADDSKHTAVPDIDISKGVTSDLVQKSGGLIENDRGVSPGANVSNEQIRLLPLFNRNFLALGLIQPGVFDVEQGSPLQGAAFSIAGSRSTSTYFLLDGVDNVASSSNQAIPFQVNEAVREFRVTYADPSLRYGQGSGGVVDVVTSNGATGSKGKGFHGTLFGYFNSDALNANTPLSVYSNSGFARAADYANNVSGGLNIIAANVAASGGTNTAPVSGAVTACNSAGAPSAFCGYSPQSYNELFGLFNTGLGIDPGCGTQICSAGAFNTAAVLATQNSFTQPFTSKQFGGSLGGPIGDRLFFFTSYEGTLINNPNSIFERVPTYLDRQTGGVSANGAADSAIAQKVLALYPGANVGQTGAAASPGSGTGIFGFYRGTAPNYTNVHNVQIRPDYSLRTLGTLSLRYTGQLLDQLHDDTLPASSIYPGNGADRRAQNQSAAISYNYPFGNNRNLLDVAFTQYRVDEVAQDRGVNASALGLPAGPLPTIVLAGVDTSTSGATSSKAGAIGGWYDSFWQTNCAPGACTAGTGGSRSPSPITPSLDGTFPLARIGAPLNAPSKRRDTEAFVSDALELRISERNFLTVGGDYRYQQNFSYDGGFARGLVVANNIGEFTHDSETCISCGAGFQHPSFDYTLRQPVGYTGDLRSSSFGVFAEHKYNPMERLTLQFGVRYDYFGQPLDTQNRLWNYNVSNQGLNRQGATGTFDAFDYQCGGGTTFFDALYGGLRASTAKGNWACNPTGSFQLPSQKHDVTGMAGFSVSPDGKFRNVIRGAIGGYYDHLPASYNQKLLQNRPSPYDVLNPSAIYGQNFYSTYSSFNCPIQTQCGFGLNSLNTGRVTDPFQTTSFVNYQAASGANILYERDPNALNTPYSIQFSTSIQHVFSGSWSGELGYVGSVGQQLPLIYDSNFANEFYCKQSASGCNNDSYFPVFTESHIGGANYQSLIARVQSRLWKGLSMHASYTFAKSLDNIASSSFPSSTDSLFTQLFGRQLYGEGNPAVSSLGITGIPYGSNGGFRGSQLITTTKVNAPTALASSVLKSANIPSFEAIESALTTTGSQSINTSQYSLPQNPLAFSSQGAATGADYGRSDFDVRQRGVADFVYNPSFLKGRYLGGFTLSGITTIQSGQPFTIFSGPAYGQLTQLINVPSTGVRTQAGNTRQYIAGLDPNLSNAVSGPNSYLPSLTNNACPNIYAEPTLYSATATPGACLGNGSRNSYTGPAYFSQDFAVQKATRGFTESQAFVVRAEMFNAFNRANYYNPISEISRDGVHYNPAFGTIRSAHDPFRLQLAVRLDF